MDWISIADKLPKEGESVIVWVASSEPFPAEADYNGKEFNHPYYGQDISGVFDNVTHWLEVKPPEGEYAPKEFERLN